jgi:hypothetical protein
MITVSVKYAVLKYGYDKRTLRKKSVEVPAEAKFTINNLDFNEKLFTYFGIDKNKKNEEKPNCYRKIGYNNKEKLPQTLNEIVVRIFHKKIFDKVIKNQNAKIKSLEIIDDSENEYKENTVQDNKKQNILSPQTEDNIPEPVKQEENIS